MMFFGLTVRVLNVASVLTVFEWPLTSKTRLEFCVLQLSDSVARHFWSSAINQPVWPVCASLAVLL